MKFSRPVFLSYEEAEKYKKDDKYGLAICACTNPICTPDGVNAHIVEYDKTYLCSYCKTTVLTHKISHNI